MIKQRKYLLALLASGLALLVGIGIFNAAVDAHRFFNLLTLPGFNQYKTYVTKMRLRKPVHIYQRKPTILIMGSSRAGGGLHCADLTDQLDKCYNSALRGITVYEQMRILEHAYVTAEQADKKLEQVVLKMSYATFTETELTKEGFDENLAKKEIGGDSFVFYKALLDKYFYALFSWEAVSDSLMTIEYQDKPYAWRATAVWSFEPDGSWSTYPLKNNINDPEKIFSNRVKQWGSSSGAMIWQFSGLKKQIDNNVSFEHNYNYYEQLLDFAYRHQIPVDIILPSEHASYLQLMDETGIWTHMERWKQRIVKINEQVAHRYHAKPYLVRDFSGFNEYSTEPTWENLTVGQSMQWYEDIVHFHGKLGAKMLATVRDHQTTGDWFSTIDSSNIENHLQKIRADKNAYVKNRAPLIPLEKKASH